MKNLIRDLRSLSLNFNLVYNRLFILLYNINFVLWNSIWVECVVNEYIIWLCKVYSLYVVEMNFLKRMRRDLFILLYLVFVFYVIYLMCEIGYIIYMFKF